MFRNALLVTTALIVAASLSSAVAGSGARAQPALSNITNAHDANEEFLRTYGGFLVSGYASKNFSSFISHWTHVAVPITGHGETVTRIRVREKGNSITNSYFSVAIYSNNASGFPGHRIVGNLGYTSGDYKPYAISIYPTKLKPNTTYWIGETVQSNSNFSSGNPHYWESNPKSKRKAYVQTHGFYSSSGGRHSSSTSPWTPQSTGPYLKVCSKVRCRG